MSLLEVRSLSVMFQKKKIVHSINIKVEPNSITALIGESGSGKSTILKVLLGIISNKNGYSLEGELFLKNRTLIPGKEKSIQPVFQDPSLYFNRSWTMKECLLEPFYFKRVPREKAEEVLLTSLTIFSLQGVNLQNSPSQFSGGELQRLSILRAFFYDPEILLMDEPVSGLDRLVLLDTIEFLHTLKREKHLTIFVVSHDLEFIESIANYIYIIHKGEIVEEGSTKEIFQSPKKEYTQILLSSRNLDGLKKECTISK